MFVQSNFSYNTNFFCKIVCCIGTADDKKHLVKLFTIKIDTNGVQINSQCQRPYLFQQLFTSLKVLVGIVLLSKNTLTKINRFGSGKGCGY